jgi:hypothetical protein
MNEEDQLILWERQEELKEFNDACYVANNNLWVNDDGSV